MKRGEEQKLLNSTSSFQNAKELNFLVYEWKQENKYLDREFFSRFSFWEIILQWYAEFIQLFLVISALMSFYFLSRCLTFTKCCQGFRKKIIIIWQNSTHSTRINLKSTIGHSSPTKVLCWDIQLINIPYNPKFLIWNLYAKSFVVFIIFIHMRIISATQVFLKLFTKKRLICSDVDYPVSTWD